MPDELLTEGITALKAGRKTEARELLTRLLEQDARNERAWLWLSGAVDTDQERRTCLENVLAINPGHKVAQRGLLSLIAKEGVRSLGARSSPPDPEPVVASPEQPTQPYVPAYRHGSTISENRRLLPKRTKTATTQTTLIIALWVACLAVALVGAGGVARVTGSDLPPTGEAAPIAAIAPASPIAVHASATSTPTAIPTWTPTPLPRATATLMPRVTPTTTPTPAATPFSLQDPNLIGVSRPLSDTTAVPTPVPPVRVPSDAINIIVLGSDRRPEWEDWHTDVVQIVSIQPAIPAVTVLSIPRDLYLYIPGFWMSRVNFADMYGEMYNYEGGGPALVQQTLLYNLGIPIDHYARTDFEGLAGIVNALGGIDVPVHCQLHDYWYYPDEKGEYYIHTVDPGVHHMDGDEALWYARSRKTSSVFDREQRQQQVLEAIWRQSRSLDLLPRIPELWGQLNSMVVTDVDLPTALQLAQIALKLDPQNVRFRNIGLQQVIPWTTPKGGSVFLPNWPELEPLISEALGPVPEGRLWRSLQAVEIWNGTASADWDQLAADRLLHQGFPVTISQSDRRDYVQTRLIDFTGSTKGSSIPYLQQMFNVSPDNVIVAPDPKMPVQYRLIIGADYQTCRRP